jgi:hypothetical protein
LRLVGKPRLASLADPYEALRFCEKPCPDIRTRGIDEQLGLHGYGYRTKITLPKELLAASQVDAWNKEFPSYAIVALTAKKPNGLTRAETIPRHCARTR